MATRFSCTAVGAAAAALVLPFLVAVVAASPADAGTPRHKHELVLYKVESTVKLSGVGTATVGDSPNQSLACNPGDYVLDGMWLVKHVDQYPSDPPDGDDERDVWVQASYPDQTDVRTWQFRFANKAYGDAQLRLAITCIDGATQPGNGHTHAVGVQHLFGGPATTVAHPTPSWSGRFYVDSGTESWGRCSPGEYFVAPGFDLGASTYRLVASYPSQGETPAPPTPTGRAWTWEFAVASTTPPTSQPASINVYGRCIDRRTGSQLSHRHSIGMKHAPGLPFTQWQQSLNPQGFPNEFQYQCDQTFTNLYNYKAMVGWFYLGNGWQDNWFIGMEPRLKLRAFTFMNKSPDPAEVRYGTLCINARTSNPIAP